MSTHEYGLYDTRSRPVKEQVLNFLLPATHGYQLSTMDFIPRYPWAWVFLSSLLVGRTI